MHAARGAPGWPGKISNRHLRNRHVLLLACRLCLLFRTGSDSFCAALRMFRRVSKRKPQHSLQTSDDDTDSAGDDSIGPDEEGSGKDDAVQSPRLCSICHESMDSLTSVITPCDHEFHALCLEQWKLQCDRVHRPVRCPICRSESCTPPPAATSIRTRADGGIDVTFDLPYSRSDVWAQMFVETRDGYHLGVSHEIGVTYSIHPPALERATSTRGPPADEGHQGALSLLNEGRYREGIQKRVSARGVHTSRLVAIAYEKMVEWELVSQDETNVSLMGAGSRNARTRIELADLFWHPGGEIAGTTVRLSYFFAKLVKKVRTPFFWRIFGPWDMNESALSSFLESFGGCGAKWEGDMRERGFVPIPAARLRTRLQMNPGPQAALTA